MDGLTFSGLKEKTGLSAVSLSAYLKTLQKTGLVKKDFEHKKYALPHIHMPMESFANDWQKFMGKSTVQFILFGHTIAGMKNRQERIVAMQNFLQASYHLLTLFLWKIIGEATAELGNDVENLKDTDLVVAKNKVIFEAMNDWVIGITDSLATAMILNLDVLDDAGTPVFDKVLQETKMYMESLKGIVESKRKHRTTNP